MMPALRWLAGALWCAAVACIPLAIAKVRAALRADIGCPAAGDCYLPGAQQLFTLDLIVLAAALLLWPVCAWWVLGRPLVGWWRRRRGVPPASSMA